VIDLYCVRRILGYLKQVIQKLRENEKTKDDEFIEAFQKKILGYYKNVIGPNFDDYDFYAGESLDDHGMYENRTFD